LQERTITKGQEGVSSAVPLLCSERVQQTNMVAYHRPVYAANYIHSLHLLLNVVQLF